MVAFVEISPRMRDSSLASSFIHIAGPSRSLESKCISWVVLSFYLPCFTASESQSQSSPEAFNSLLRRLAFLFFFAIDSHRRGGDADAHGEERIDTSASRLEFWSIHSGVEDAHTWR